MGSMCNKQTAPQANMRRRSSTTIAASDVMIRKMSKTNSTARLQNANAKGVFLNLARTG